MASYAELDENGEVMNVIVVDDAHEGDSLDPAVQEVGGLAWLATFPPSVGKTYKKTWENGERRVLYAGIGMTYDATRDAFIPTV